MPRVLVNIQRGEYWFVHFIGPDNNTRIGPWLLLDSHDEARAILHWGSISADQLAEHESSIRRWSTSSVGLELSERQIAQLIERGKDWPWNGYELLQMKKAGKYPKKESMSVTRLTDNRCVDDNKSMTDEERRAFLEQWDQENRAAMTPFQLYLVDNGLFDDVIRPELSEDDVILKPADLCSDVGCEHCIGYWKRDGKVSFCTCEHHKNVEDRNVPYDHCEYLGCVNCPGVVTENTTVSYCTCGHHRDGGTDPLTSGPHDREYAKQLG